MNFVRIPMIGGPLDGEERDHQICPADKAELTHNGHSYEFCLVEWSWLYKQRWQHVEQSGCVVTFRTYRELMFNLGVLIGRGELTAEDSLKAQQKVAFKLGKSFIKYESNNGKPCI